MWRAIYGLSRFIATPRVAKHRLFVWLDLSVCPDSAAIAIARDDDTSFGILHSRLHEAWSLRFGTWLGKGKDSRYTPTTTFEIFPSPTASPPTFLPPITPTTRAPEPSPKLREGWWSCAIAGSTRREWVKWVDEPVFGYPKRPVAHDNKAARELQKRTLTNLYNARPL